MLDVIEHLPDDLEPEPGLADNGKAKIFQASTSEVYGDPAIHLLCG
ncbi:hypothetical protein [Thiohalocapsa marina]